MQPLLFIDFSTHSFVVVRLPRLTQLTLSFGSAKTPAPSASLPPLDTSCLSFSKPKVRSGIKAGEKVEAFGESERGRGANRQPARQ